MPVQLPSLQSMLKRNVPDPSTKNGRRSGKNVSNASRLTTAGSASTWPKSGFAVAVSVRPGVTAYFMSSPSAAPGSMGLLSGLPASSGCVRRSATVYGSNSNFFGAPAIFKPRISPNCETNPLALRDSKRPAHRLRKTADLTNHREAHRAAGERVEPQLRERNLELGAPAVVVALDLHVPHRVPAVVALTVVEVVAIRLDANGIDAELIRRPLVEVRIDDDADPVRGGALIAAGENADEFVGDRCRRRAPPHTTPPRRTPSALPCASSAAGLRRAHAAGSRRSPAPAARFLR